MRHHRAFGLLIVFGLLLVFGACQRDQRREIEEKVVTTVEHNPPGRIVNGGNAVIRVNVKSTAPPEVVLYYRIGLEWTAIPMNPVGDEEEPVYEAEIPRQPRGTMVEYYIDVRTAAGSRLTLPGKAPDRLYVLRFQGVAPDWLQVGHRLVLYTALALSLVAAILAFLVIKGRLTFLTKIPFLVSVAAGLYFLGGILLQMIVSWYVDARIWSGFPVGANSADTKSLVLVLFWGLVAALTHTRVFRRQDEAAVVRGNQLAVLVLAGALLTVILFLLPDHPNIA